MAIGINGPLSGADGRDESAGRASDANRRAEADVRPIARETPQPLQGLPRTSGDGAPSDTAPPAEHRPRLMITAGQSLRDRYEAAFINRLREQLSEAGDGISEAIGASAQATAKADRDTLSIVNARQHQLRTFVHRTPDTFAIIAQDDPAFFARAVLDGNGMLHVADATRFVDERGRQQRAAGLDTPGFLERALAHFGAQNVRGVDWCWDARGDGMSQFSETLSRIGGVRQSVESSRIGAVLAHHGFSLAHTEITDSHIEIPPRNLPTEKPRRVYDRLALRWEKKPPSESTKRSSQIDPPGSTDASEEAIDMMQILKMRDSRRMPEILGDAFASRPNANLSAPLRIRACPPEIAQRIADLKQGPVILEDTLINGEPALYSPRARIPFDYDLSAEEVAWTLRSVVSQEGFFIDRGGEKSKPRIEWMQALADILRVPVALPHENPKLGDELTVVPANIDNRGSIGIDSLRRRHDDRTVAVARLELRTVVGPDHATEALVDFFSKDAITLGSLEGTTSLRRLAADIREANERLAERADPVARVERLLVLQSNGEHIEGLAQAVADHFDIFVDVVENPGKARLGDPVDDIADAGLKRYSPRTRLRVTHESVREFSEHILKNVMLSTSGIVLHPDSLPPSWSRIKAAALQTLADMLNVPVALAKFDEAIPDERGPSPHLASSGTTKSRGRNLYRDELSFSPEPAQQASFDTDPSGDADGKLSAVAPGAGIPQPHPNSRPLESAALWLPVVLEDLEARLGETEANLALAEHALAEATQAFAKADDESKQALDALIRWEADASLEMLRDSFPEDVFGPFDEEFEARAREWFLSGSLKRYEDERLSKLLFPLLDRARIRARKEAAELEDASDATYEALSEARKALKTNKSEGLQSREKEIIALHQARAAARKAQRLIGEALGAQTFAKGDGSGAAHDIAEVYASRANRALTGLYVALEPLPEEVWRREERA